MARLEKGWVKMHRKVLDSDIGRSFMLLGLWMTLIRWANWTESKINWRGTPRTLGRGELLTSVKELAKYGEVDRKTVTKWINYLEKRGSILVEKSPKGSRNGLIIKVLNYDKYQSVDAVWSHEDGGEAGCEHGDESPMRVDTYKESKNIRKKELINTPPKPETPEELLSLVGEKNMKSLLNDFDKEILDREFPEIVYYLQNNETVTVKKYGLFVRNWIKRAIRFEEQAAQKALAKQNAMGIKAG